MIHVLYSTDYEVYLGGNRAPEREVLIDTTDRLVAACDELSVPLTLFCDVACIWRYRETGLNEFPDQVEAQLLRLVGAEHDVQAHLHPHWLVTRIEHDAAGHSHYRTSLDKYLLGNWTPPDGRTLHDFCRELFCRARDYLHALLRPARPGYNCIAFRAGGYGLQPHSDVILSALRDAGYLIDSSVVPGMKLDSNVNRVDFTQVPRVGNYRLEAEGSTLKASGTGLFEIPIPSSEGLVARRALAGSLVNVVRGRVLRHLKRSAPGASPLGYPIQSVSQARRANRWELMLKKLRAIRRGWAMLELSNDAELMLAITDEYIRRYISESRDLYFSFSSHSKGVTNSNLVALRDYHRGMVRKYGSAIRAITFQQAARQLDQGNSGQEH